MDAIHLIAGGGAVALVAGAAGAGLALRLGPKLLAAARLPPSLEARLAVVERRTGDLERARGSDVDTAARTTRALKAQMHDIANLLRRIAEQQRKAEGAAAKRTEFMVQRLSDQVESLADRVLDLDAKLGGGAPLRADGGAPAPATGPEP